MVGVVRPMRRTPMRTVNARASVKAVNIIVLCRVIVLQAYVVVSRTLSACSDFGLQAIGPEVSDKCAELTFGTRVRMLRSRREFGLIASVGP